MPNLKKTHKHGGSWEIYLSLQWSQNFSFCLYLQNKDIVLFLENLWANLVLWIFKPHWYRFYALCTCLWAIIFWTVIPEVSCVNHLGGKKFKIQNSCHPRKNKSLQTSCRGNDAYKITNIVITSTCHMERDAGAEPLGISVWISIRKQGCLLHPQMCCNCRNVGW